MLTCDSISAVVPKIPSTRPSALRVKASGHQFICEGEEGRVHWVKREMEEQGVDGWQRGWGFKYTHSCRHLAFVCCWFHLCRSLTVPLRELLLA